jgi:hypothetical protein
MRATPTDSTFKHEWVVVVIRRAGQVVRCQAPHHVFARGSACCRLTIYRDNHDGWRKPLLPMSHTVAMGWAAPRRGASSRAMHGPW